MSDRTHPTSFQARPPSPHSPAGQSLKENHQLPISSDHIPQTPISPPLMSVSDQSHASDFTSSHISPNQAPARPLNISSPPSSAPMSTQASQQPAMSTNTSFSTPDSNVSGHQLKAPPTDIETGMQDSAESVGAGLDQPSTEQRSDHQASRADGTADFVLEQGQHSTDPDSMDLDTELTRQTDTSNLSFGSLQKELASAFHLCKSCKIPHLNYCCLPWTAA